MLEIHEDYSDEDKAHFNECYEKAVLKDYTKEIVELFIIKYFTEIIGLRPEFHYSIENRIFEDEAPLKNVFNKEFVLCKGLICNFQKSKSFDDLFVLYNYAKSFIEKYENKYNKIMFEKTRLLPIIKLYKVHNEKFIISAVKDINYMFTFLCNYYKLKNI
jgi:hypothetical protein